MKKREEAWASKIGLVTLLDIEWKKPNHGSLVELLNTFVIKIFEIYFRKDGTMYVINKQMMVDAFSVCQVGYVEDSKGQVEQISSRRVVIQWWY